MNPQNIFDNIGPGQNFLFNVKFVNLEYIFYKIYVFFGSIFGLGTRAGGGSGGSGIAFDSTTFGRFFIDSPSGKVFNFPLAGEILKDVLYVLIILFMTIICYSLVRIFEIRKKETEHLNMEIEEYARKQEEQEMRSQGYQSKNPRWDQVVRYMNSQVESDWRLAILEADSMLEDLLDMLGFEGESIGEKLKNVGTNKEKFRQLNLAWDAHAIRNKVAHDGSAFVLNLREASRVVGLYEQIFRDYDFI